MARASSHQYREVGRRVRGRSPGLIGPIDVFEVNGVAAVCERPIVPVDKSLLYYGRTYHKLFDPQLAEARRVVVDLVAKGSSVLDIACGTGQLCFALRTEKQCRVIGIDLSLRMLQFAERLNRYDDVEFLHLDASDLSAIEDRAFDFATVLFLMHELPRDGQLRVLSETMRVADKVILVDSKAPLPRNLSGLGIRIVEATFGREHSPSFKRFLAEGGLPALLEASGLPLTVTHRSCFWRNCREVLVLSHESAA